VTATDGVLFISRPRKPVLATTDGGRQWKAIPIAPRGFPVEASGRDLFWISQQGSDIRKLYKMRNAVLGHTRTAVVASFPDTWIFEAVRAIPGGAAALANKFEQDDSQFALVVYTDGRCERLPSRRRGDQTASVDHSVLGEPSSTHPVCRTIEWTGVAAAPKALLRGGISNDTTPCPCWSWRHRL